MGLEEPQEKLSGVRVGAAQIVQARLQIGPDGLQMELGYKLKMGL